MISALLQVRVARRHDEAQDICSFELVPVDGGGLPPFTAGAHIDVHVPGGPIRNYSLCNDPRETHRYLIGVLREPASRGGSAGMHDRVKAGQVLTISVPRNHFPLAAEARRSLLLAGGIGITPLLSMAQALGARGDDFELHYCARSRNRAAFVERLISAPLGGRTVLHLDDGDARQRLDIDALLRRADGEGTHLYVCGPRGFIDAVLGGAHRLGWPQARLHSESFVGAVTASDADQAFEVELAHSGRVVQVPRDATIVRALHEAGVDVMVSCEQGVCGTCLTRVIAGVPDHRDSYLTPQEQAEGTQMLLCCSRAKSGRLVLDL